MEIAKHCTAYLSVVFFFLFLLPTESPVKSQQSVNRLFAYPNSPLPSQPYIFLLPSLDLVHVFQSSLFPVRFFFFLTLGWPKKFIQAFPYAIEKPKRTFWATQYFQHVHFSVALFIFSFLNDETN